MMAIPEIVLRLSERVQGKPIAWKEREDGWHIVFADGRKIHFERAAVKEEHSRDRGVASLAQLETEHISNSEANSTERNLAPAASQRHKKRKGGFEE